MHPTIFTASSGKGAGYPTREDAHRLLEEALTLNPGPWGDHCRVAAKCAASIAALCGLDAEKAYVLGLLHDIGRREGVSHLRHVWDGMRFMHFLGYADSARICLTHSFPNFDPEEYCGQHDLPPEEEAQLRQMLLSVKPDDYDRLIQLTDALSGTAGIMDMESRMADVERRYGFYPEAKKQKNRDNLRYFEMKAGRSLAATLKEIKP